MVMLFSDGSNGILAACLNIATHSDPFISLRVEHDLALIQQNCATGALQFIDRMVDDPAVMQREASTIEARDDQDGPRGPRQDAAGSTRQADEVSGATPLVKTRRKAVAQDLDQSPQDQNADALDL